jgi:hypothetical protein
MSEDYPVTPPRSPQITTMPATNPSLRGTHTMSLRPHTYHNSSPSTPPISRLGSYPFPESPTRSPVPLAQEQHINQMASYRREAGRNRFATLGAVLSPGGTRRLSAVVENGADDRKDRRDGFWGRIYRVLFYPLVKGRRRKNWKYLFYLMTAAIVYFTLFHRSSPRTSVSGYTSSSAGNKAPPPTARSQASKKPLKLRPKLGPRPGLPGGVASKSQPDHPIQGGLLKVDPESLVHPIYQLIRDGREEWDHKVARQSRTLKDAVQEYRNRYGRQPPVGFDKWWDYVW